MNEEFCFPGPGGVVWTHRVRTFGMTAKVGKHLPYRDEPGYIKARRNEDATRIGHELLAQAAVHREADDGNVITHDWRFSVVMPDGDRNWFAEQVDAAKADGLREGLKQAAALTRARASRYVRTEGACSHVLMHELQDTAKAIESIPVESV